MTTERIIDELLSRIDSREVRGLIRALSVYLLDPQHAFDRMARLQADVALAEMADYAGIVEGE